MRILKRLSRVMELPWAYALWQAPFLNAKFAPILEHNDIGSVRRVLDVGCGPGTNTRFFAHADYVGLDINPAYIERARRKYRRTFLQADVCDYRPSVHQHYDFVLLNSLLHHLDDANTHRILGVVRDVLVAAGCVHIVDLILPESRGIARYLTQNDRGDYPRRWEAWQELLSRHFEPVVQQPFSVGIGAIELWRMLYFKGRPKR